MAARRAEFVASVSAEDDASQVLEDIADAGEQLERDPIKVRVDADGRELTELEKEIDKLPNREKIIALSVRAGAAASELRDLTAQIATIDENDPEISVTFDRYREVSGQLDDLEAKIKAVGDADPDAGASLVSARDRLREVGDEADRTKGAVHSMAGGSVGDFAATATGIGPLGEAISQLTEQAVGGEAGLRGLATAGLGLGAIAGGMVVVNKVLGEFEKRAQKAAEIKAFNAANVEAYAKAIREGTDAVEGYIARVQEAGKVEVLASASQAGGWRQITADVVDLTDQLSKAGISIEQFASATTGSDEDVARFASAVDQMGLSTTEANEIITAAQNEHANYAAALERSTKFSALFADQSAKVFDQQRAVNAEAQRWSGIAAQYAADTESAATAQQAASETVAEAARAQSEALQGVADGYRDAQAAQEALLDSSANAADSQRAANEAYLEFGEVIGDNNTTSKEATDAAISFAKAQEKAKSDSAAAAGQIRTNTEQVDSLNDSLIATAGASRTGQSEILEYILKLNRIPEEKSTAIRAAMAAGDLETVDRLLTEASNTRTVAVEADASGFYADLNTARAEAAKPVEVPIKLNTNGIAASLGRAIKDALATNIRVNGNG